jgi:transcriptional regulator with XRE-family HTH domain
MNALGRFLRQRAKELGIRLADIARDSDTGRNTLYAISAERTGGSRARLPDLDTLVRIALVLEVHPLKLVQLVFEDYPLSFKQARGHKARGDQSVFVADVTIPDSTVVLTGARFTKIWEVQNMGTVPWENRFLVCMDDDLEVRSTETGQVVRVTEKLIPDVRRIPVPLTLPGAKVRIAVDFQAPSIPCSSLSYWKSIFEDGTFCLPNSVGLSCVVRVISMRSEDPVDGGLIL